MASSIRTILYSFTFIFSSHILIGITILFGVTTASYIANPEAAISKHPLGVANHPSTYFDSIKPVYNEFTYYGIYIKLPIGDVIKHARTALQFIHNLPYKSSTRELHNATSSGGGNSIKTADVDPNLVWLSSMGHMLRLKVDALSEKIREMEKSIEAHATPADSLYEAMAMHQKSKTRFRKSIDINLDVTGAIHSFFDGISSMFHYQSMRQLGQSIKNMQITMTRLEDFTVDFATRMASLLKTLEIKRREETNTLSSILTSFMILDEAESAMDVVAQAITPLLQGIIPTYVVTPAALVELFEAVKESAAQNGLELAIQNPNEILKIQPMTFQRGKSYEMVISLPVVDPKLEFQTFHLVNLPTLRKRTPTVWDLPDLIYGLRPTLYPETVEHIAVEVTDIPKACTEYYMAYLCHVPTITRPDCVADLFHNLSTNCLTRTMTYVPTVMRATQDILFFFEESTKALIQCGDDFARLSLEGLVRMEDKANCLVTTDGFTYTFVGNTPSRMFQSKTPKIVDDSLMPDPPEILMENDLERNISMIEDIVQEYNRAREEQRQPPETPVVNYVSLAIGLMSLLALVSATVMFLLKAQGYLCCGGGGVPPA